VNDSRDDFFYNVELEATMKLPSIGEFERAVLLAVIQLGDEAYGVAIRDHLEHVLDRTISFGAVYTTLDRLIAKAAVTASVGPPTAVRGGRAKKFFRLTSTGRRALERSLDHSRAILSMLESRSRV
jgi:PadR family transcriptional regulator PadR